MPVFGIDLGTTYSAIATLDDNGQPKLIQNLVEGSFILPSVVYFEDGATPCVGKEAKSNAEVYPDRVIQFVKRDIGKPNGRTINFDGKMEDPISISAYILKRLAEYSKEQDYDVKDVVITVPAYFGIEERNATRQAGEMAGFNVLGIVNEPTAAAINYCYGQQGNQKILVYDLGGGTFDVSIIEMITNDDGTIKIDIIDSDGNDRLGGMDWDKRLADFVLNEYAQQENISVDDIKPEMMHRIKTSAEGAKIALSTTINRNVTIPSNSEEGRMVKINVTREIFNDLTRDLVNRTMSYLNLLLQRNSMTPDDISTVLLVGGSTMMHIIMETVESMFKNSRVIRHDPNLAVAKGAALYAKINAEKAVEEILRERKKNPQPGPGPDPDNTNKTEPPIPPLSEDTMREIEQELQSGTSSVSNIEVSDILSCSVGVLINRRMGDGDYYN
ncbi:MAG: Hsp70 family protein, partial [Oscillospiraceae bacterium]|nr:Hsp70 family protein [Oscillospiraceae bacterium]